MREKKPYPILMKIKKINTKEKLKSEDMKTHTVDARSKRL